MPAGLVSVSVLGLDSAADSEAQESELDSVEEGSELDSVEEKVNTQCLLYMNLQESKGKDTLFHFQPEHKLVLSMCHFETRIYQLYMFHFRYLHSPGCLKKL